MAAAFDAAANSANSTDPSWTHTPVGTPRGIVVLVIQQAGSLETVTATYGGVSMTALTVIDGSAASEPAWIYPFILTSGSIPTGAQTVAVTADGSTSKIGASFSVTAGADLVVDDEDFLVASSQDDPSRTLTATADVVVFSALFSGLGNAANVTAGTGFTKTFGGSISAATGNFMRSTSAFSAGSVSVPWTTSAADDVVMYAIAVKESSGGSPQNVSVSGLGSASAFGAPTAAPGGVNVSVSALASASAFGTPTIAPGGTVVAVSGLGSASAFGSVVVDDQIVSVSGLGSASAFGTPGVAVGNVNVPVTGLGSASQFGAITTDGGDAPTFSPAIHGGKHR